MRKRELDFIDRGLIAIGWISEVVGIGSFVALILMIASHYLLGWPK